MSFITLAPDMTLAYLLTQRLMEHVQNESHEVWDVLEHSCVYPELSTEKASIIIYYWNRTRHKPLRVDYFWTPAKTTPDMEHCRCHATITEYDGWEEYHYPSYIEYYKPKQA